MDAVSVSPLNSSDFQIIITMVANADKNNMDLKPWIINGHVDSKIFALFDRAIIVTFL